jgi:hypothetical protein
MLQPWTLRLIRNFGLWKHSTHSIQYSVMVIRGNGVTLRTQKVIQGDDNGHVGRPCEVSLAPPYPELFASYGASAVTRTSDRGHVAEARNQGHRSAGVSIRASKETFLPLNVHRCIQYSVRCSVSSTKMLKTVH